MTRPRRGRDREPGLSPLAWAMLTDAPLPEDVNQAELFWLTDCDGDEMPNGDPTLLGLWRVLGLEIVESWSEEHPGTRPSCWWSWSAPAGQTRQRLGGTGTPKHEVLGYAPRYEFGIPVLWTERWEVEFYNGRAQDVHGHPIGTSYHSGDFAGVALSPDAPPIFEAQAAYLQRLNLLLPGEKRRLSAADFEPVAFDAQAYLARAAASKDEFKQRCIQLGTWRGEP